MLRLLSSQNLGSVELHDGIHLIHRERVFRHVCLPKTKSINNYNVIFARAVYKRVNVSGYQTQTPLITITLSSRALFTNASTSAAIKHDNEHYKAPPRIHRCRIISPSFSYFWSDIIETLHIKTNYCTNRVHARDPRRQPKQNFKLHAPLCRHFQPTS